MPPARISLTLSRYISLSFIAAGLSLGLHPVSSQSCCMYVRAGRPAFARPYVGVHRSSSLMSSSLLLQQCPACLVRLTWIVFVMGCRWPYSWCFVGCYLQVPKQTTFTLHWFPFYFILFYFILEYVATKTKKVENIILSFFVFALVFVFQLQKKEKKRHHWLTIKRNVNRI